MKAEIASSHAWFRRIAKIPPTAVALALSFCGLTPAQIAPGPLSRAHQQLEGLTKCGSCHNFGSSTSDLKCLECHAEIRRRVDARLGFHSRAYKSSAGETDCRRCHKEHSGLGSALIRLDRRNFDHLAQTGFALAGKHLRQKCENCHAAAKIPAAARAEIKLKDLNRSFLGLRRECTACHKDPHQDQLGSDCLRCHSQDAFKPAPGFNHAGTHFPLTGLHQPVLCQKCHGPRPGQAAVRWKGLAFSGCQNCHADPHRGAFQQLKFRGSCDTCHNTNGWKNNHPGGEFNHSTTKYPLTGKHAAVACSKCHKGADFRRPIAHERCRDCHDDPHKGQFAARAAGSDCSACHEVRGFKPSRFDRAAHRQTAFPLEEKHAPLRCAECHQPEGRGAVYVSRKLICSACHADRHGGEFASTPHSNQCDHCHTPAGFQPSTFSVARHAQTQFALTGRHASIACDRCHKPLPTVGVPAPIPVTSKRVTPSGPPRQYRFASRTCNACHADPHQTKVACETCHTSEQWQPARPFDHSTTRFRIDGAHQNVKCIQCHIPSAQGSNPVAKAALKLSATSRQCFGCHAAKDAHAGEFRSGMPEEDCSHCHTTARWNGEAFDHDKARFVLDRVHRNVACAKCHKDQREVAGKMIRTYRGAPLECVKCH